MMVIATLSLRFSEVFISVSGVLEFSMRNRMT